MLNADCLVRTSNLNDQILRTNTDNIHETWIKMLRKPQIMTEIAREIFGYLYSHKKLHSPTLSRVS